ncbi:hypothetical protein cypCar_00012420, partial [Cyprinus carpio]
PPQILYILCTLSRGPSSAANKHYLISTPLMSAEASGSSCGNVVTVSGSAASSSSHVGQEKAGRSLAGSKYVKLNVGGTLHYTTVQTLSKEDSLLRSICDGSTEVTIDSEGWVVLDRCGRHFSLVLNFLRDGTVPLPETTRELEEVLKEAQYYRLQGLVQHCLTTLEPVVKLQNNRGNNKYSYTSNSDDNLLKNIELFDKLGLRFNGRVEFPEARIFEETLNILIYENGRGSGGMALLESGGVSSPGVGQSEEEGAGVGGGDRRVRRIHVRRHIMHDERGHGQQTVYKD